MEFERVNIVDSRFIQDVPRVEMLKGASSVSKNVAAVTGGTVNSSMLSWQIPITSAGLAVDMRWYVEYSVSFTINCQATGADSSVVGGAGLLVPGINICPAAYPLNSLITNASVLINEKQICAIDISQYSPLVLRLSDMQKLNPDSSCPSMVEMGISDYTQSFLTRANAMASYNDADFGGNGFVPNGSWNMTFAVPAGQTNPGKEDTKTNVVVTCNWFEPLLISPCDWQTPKSEPSGSCPFYVRNIQINCPIGDPTRFFRFNQSATVNGATTLINTVSAPTFTVANLHYFTLAPPLLDGYRLPSTSIHHTYDFKTNSVMGVPFTAGAIVAPSTQVSITQREITLSNVNLTGMPKYIILGVTKDKLSYGFNQSNFFFPISKVVVSSQNNQNILASFNQTDLFNLSRKNGAKIDYNGFCGTANVSGYSGAGEAILNSFPVQLCSGPVILEVSDLDLPYNITNGSSGNFVFNFTVTANNTEYVVVTGGAPTVTATSTPFLKALFVYDEYLITDGATLQSDIKQSFLSPTAPLESAPIHASGDVAGLSGGVLHKMGQAKGGPSNLSKAQAIAKLSKRLTY
jgi:hypothetical protein